MSSTPLCSVVLVSLLFIFCLGTRWGQTYPDLTIRAWQVFVKGSRVDAELRNRVVLDETYPHLLYIRRSTPPDAVILLPPRQFVIDKVGGEQIPLLASPSSTYNFIYPRIPVHYGDPSPHKDRITMVLIWEHWGIDLIDPTAPRDEDHRYRLAHWPVGKEAPW